MKDIEIAGSRHLMLSGSGTAGSIQAPLLALHVTRLLKENSLDAELQRYGREFASSLDILAAGLQQLDDGFEPKDVVSSNG